MLPPRGRKGKYTFCTAWTIGPDASFPSHSGQRKENSREEEGDQGTRGGGRERGGEGEVLGYKIDGLLECTCVNRYEFHYYVKS